MPTTTNIIRSAGFLSWATAACVAVCAEGFAMDVPDVAFNLTPRPQHVTLGEGHCDLGNVPRVVRLPAGPAHEACRSVVTTALQRAGVAIDAEAVEGTTFVIGQEVDLPDLPTQGHAVEAYVLRVTPGGVTARGASAAALLYAAQTLRQLVRLSSAEGPLPCLTIFDYPEFPMRGLYIEGGQERFGRIVNKDYLLDQIRRLAEFKMNVLVLECYNLVPYASFPACADEGTLSKTDCREIIDEAKRFHVTIVPSLQTLAQAHELVWACEEGAPYREVTAPGLMCPSHPDVYPFIKGLYRDLLTWFDRSPVIGIGCSEIDMQWKERYCPACRRRVEAGETVRDLLLGHAVQCIAAVREVSTELGRPVRPLMWADEFYMYGPGKDWIGIERIPKDTLMGYWKYWPDYSGINGLLERGYDVLGISAMYNHSFYLADLSPGDPPKAWPPMEQTGTRNITAMLREADAARRADPGGEFWGVATASFSKHRLRAFDSIWYGFALNGHAAWSHPAHPWDEYQETFTQAFARHYYDTQTDEAADALARVYVGLDRCKSRLELTNQTLGDVVGVYDTQEPGYQGNTLMGAFRRCGHLMAAGDESAATVSAIRAAAVGVVAEAGELTALVAAQETHVGRIRELTDLWLAGEKIVAHGERHLLIVDAQGALTQSKGQPADLVRKQIAREAVRWTAHRARMERILRRSDCLYSRGDPLGLAALIRDIAAIETHLKDVAHSGGPLTESAKRNVLLDERFETLDPATWIILGHPRIADGQLETRAPGGWSNYCGIATRQAFELDDDRPLVVEFELTPLEMGVDSQLFASATETGAVSYRFSFYGPTNRFGIYTQSSHKLGELWVSPESGWQPRAFSPAVEINTSYLVRARITQGTWRVTVREHDQEPLQPPLWDTGVVPMDKLARTRLTFADVEPENGAGASRWGRITIWRAP